MAPSKTPGQNQEAASETFLKKQAAAQGLGGPNAPAHKEGHAPGEAPVASDSGVTANVGIEGGTTNIPGEKGNLREAGEGGDGSAGQHNDPS